MAKTKTKKVALDWRTPGHVCRVNGHVGRYLGYGLGVYLADEERCLPRERRHVRVWRAQRPQTQDFYTAMSYPDMLPSIEQLERALLDNNCKHH